MQHLEAKRYYQCGCCGKHYKGFGTTKLVGTKEIPVEFCPNCVGGPIFASIQRNNNAGRTQGSKIGNFEGVLNGGTL